MKTNRRNFSIDLDSGEKAERELAAIFKKKMNNFKFVEKVDHERYDFDLRLTLMNDNGQNFDKNIEVKALEGRQFIQWGSKKIAEHLNTGVVEVWANDAKTKRPKWHSDDVDIIVFKNKVRGKFYFYSAQSVIEYLKKWNGPLTYAKNECDDTSGWIMKFYWSPDEDVHSRFRDESMFLPGYLFTMDGEVEDDLPSEKPHYI